MRTLITAAATLALVLASGCGKDEKKKSAELTQADRDKMVGLYETSANYKSAGYEYAIVTTDNKMYFLEKNSSDQLEIRVYARDLKKLRYTFDGKSLGNDKERIVRIGGPAEASQKGLGPGAMSYVKMADLMLHLNIRLRAENLRVMTIWDQVRVEKYPITDIQLSLLQTLIDNAASLISYLKDKKLEGVVFGNFTNDTVFKDDSMVWFGTGLKMTSDELVEKLKSKTLL